MASAFFTQNADGSYGLKTENKYYTYNDSENKVYNADGSRPTQGSVFVDDSGKYWYMDEATGHGLSESDYIAKNGSLPGATSTTKKTTTESSTADYQKEMYALYDQLAQSQQNLINTQAQMQEQQAKAANDKAVQDQVNSLKRTWEDTVTNLNQQRATNAYQKAQAADNAALRNAQAGDMGGIGQKQYSDSQSAYDSRALQIDLEATNLKNQVEREVADAIANGDYATAQSVLEIGLAKVQNLMNSQNSIYSAKSSLASGIDSLSYSKEQSELSKFQTMLSMGIFDAEAAKALGIPVEQAEQYANYVNQMQKLNAEEAALELQQAYKTYNSSGNDKDTGNTDPLANMYAIFANLYANGITPETSEAALRAYVGNNDNQIASYMSAYSNWYNSQKNTQMGNAFGLGNGGDGTSNTTTTANGGGDYITSDTTDNTHQGKSGKFLEFSPTEKHVIPSGNKVQWNGVTYNTGAEAAYAIAAANLPQDVYDTLMNELVEYGYIRNRYDDTNYE